MTGEFLPLSNDLLCSFQHILNKDPISPGRIIYQNMGHSAHQLPVLNNRAAAHADVNIGPTKGGIFRICSFYYAR